MPQGDLLKHHFDNLNLLVFLELARREHDRGLPAFSHPHERILSDGLHLVYRPSLITSHAQARLPAWLVVVKADEKSSFNVCSDRSSFFGNLPFSRVVVREKMDEPLLGDVGIEDEVVVLKAVLVIASSVAFVRVELPVYEYEFLTRWEQVAFRTHAKTNLRVIIDLTRPKAFFNRCALDTCRQNFSGRLFSIFSLGLLDWGSSDRPLIDGLVGGSSLGIDQSLDVLGLFTVLWPPWIVEWG